MTFYVYIRTFLTRVKMPLNFSIPDMIVRKQKELLREVQLETVRALAERFGFSFDHAMKFLDSDGKIEMVPERIPLAAMPWIGVVNPNNCTAIGFKKGLYTQCDGAGPRCKKCASLEAKNGTLPYGDVHARLASDVMDYKPNVCTFLKSMETNGWTEAQVLSSAQYYNGTVDPRNFQKKTRSRGRPANVGMAAPPIPVEFEETRDSRADEPPSPPYVPLRPEPVASPEPEVVPTEPAAEPAEPTEPAAESESESEDEGEDAPLTEDYVNGLNKADLIVEGKRLGLNLKENGKPRKMADVKEEIIRRFVRGNGATEDE